MYFFNPSLDCLVGLTSYIKAGLMNYEGIFIYNIMLLHSRPCLPPCTRMRPVLQQNSLQVFSCLPLSPPLSKSLYISRMVRYSLVHIVWHGSKSGFPVGLMKIELHLMPDFNRNIPIRMKQRKIEKIIRLKKLFYLCQTIWTQVYLYNIATHK